MMSNYRSLFSFISIHLHQQQKNHTGRNYTVRTHANGIKKARNFVSVSLKGMDPKFLKNLRYSKKHNRKVAKTA